MKRILLTQGHFALIDDDLFVELNRFSWYILNAKGKLYAARKVSSEGKSTHRLMHHEIFHLKGEPKPTKTDHRDRNGLNNQWHNLRPATNSENGRNRGRGKNNTSGYIGVSRKGKKWRAIVTVNNKNIQLGCFDDPVHAAAIRDDYIRKHFPEFGVTNNLPTVGA